MADVNLKKSSQSKGASSKVDKKYTKGDEQGLPTLMTQKQDQGESFLPKPAKEKQALERLYWVDWLRSIGIHVVIIVQVIILTDIAFGEEQVGRDTAFAQQLLAIQRIFVQFGIPVYFYMSGVSAMFFNFDKKSPFLRFLISKTKRLLFPLALGIFFLLMPTYYMIQNWCSWGRLDNGMKQEHNPFSFVFKQLGDRFYTKLGVLWFLLFLFVLMMLNFPVIKWTNRRYNKKAFDHEDKTTIAQQAVFLLIWDRFSWMLQDHSSNDYVRHVMPCNMILGIAYATVFLIQWRIQTRLNEMDHHTFNGVCGFYFMGGFFQLMFCAFLPEREGLNTCAITIQMCFYSIFFIQGLLVATWRDIIHADWEHFRQCQVYPIFIPIALCVQSLTLPGNYSLMASVHVYPIYRNFHLNCVFIYGAWVTAYAVLWMARGQINEVFNPAVYKLTTESSLWCFISHTLFAFAFLTFFVVPYKDHFPFALAILLCLVFTEVMCFTTYLLSRKILNKLLGNRRQQQTEEAVADA